MSASGDAFAGSELFPETASRWIEERGRWSAADGTEECAEGIPILEDVVSPCGVDEEALCEDRGRCGTDCEGRLGLGLRGRLRER